MKLHAPFAAALLAALPLASSIAAAEESAPIRQQEASDPASSRDVAVASVETRTIPDNLQAARKPDESPFNDIKILPSF